jgi:hypothetical protein
LTRLEVGDGPDSRVPPVSDWSKKKRERGGAGPAGWRIGPTWAVARAGRRKRKGLPAWAGCGPKVKGERDRERERVLPFSFKFSFQIRFSNIQTSIKQNPCIRIMMHKHLLFLNYFSDV